MFHVKHEGWSSVVPRLTPTQMALLERYERTLATEAVARGFISQRDLPRLHDRHVLDGLRGVSIVPTHAKLCYDLGSGAGIPGIPMAVAMPGLRFVLSEVRNVRTAFLERTVADLGLSNVEVYAGKAEGLPVGADVCLARAFRPAAATWLVAAALLADRGVLLYWAGRRASVDIAGVRARPFLSRSLAEAGPVVMMARQ